MEGKAEMTDDARDWAALDWGNVPSELRGAFEKALLEAPRFSGVMYITPQLNDAFDACAESVGWEPEPMNVAELKEAMREQEREFDALGL